MASAPIIAQIAGLRQRRHARRSSNLRELAEDEAQLPDFVRQSPVATRYLRLLGPLTWDRYPERDLTLGWPGEPVPYAALAAACLIKLDQGLATVSALRRYLVDHQALVWVLGFPLVASDGLALGLRRGAQRAQPQAVGTGAARAAQWPEDQVTADCSW